MKKSILSLSAAVALGGLGFAGAANAVAVFDTDGATATATILHPAGTGTRIAEPSSLPFSSGSTSPTARAAPVVVGIIDIAAARARRGSSWIWSRIFWSLV